MAHQLEVFWFSEQPYGHVTEDDLAPWESGRMHFPNTYFDPKRPMSSTPTTMTSTSWRTKLVSTASCPTSTTVPTGA